MKPNHILITGSIITIGLIILWQFKIIGEPIAALGGAILTLIGFIVSKSKEEKKMKSTNISQTHTGMGDNIGRDKITKN